MNKNFCTIRHKYDKNLRHEIISNVSQSIDSNRNNPYMIVKVKARNKFAEHQAFYFSPSFGLRVQQRMFLLNITIQNMRNSTNGFYRIVTHNWLIWELQGLVSPACKPSTVYMCHSKFLL